jgi:hypothetical protein
VKNFVTGCEVLGESFLKRMIKGGMSIMTADEAPA